MAFFWAYKAGCPGFNFPMAPLPQSLKSTRNSFKLVFLHFGMHCSAMESVMKRHLVKTSCQLNKRLLTQRDCNRHQQQNLLYFPGFSQKTLLSPRLCRFMFLFSRMHLLPIFLFANHSCSSIKRKLSFESHVLRLYHPHRTSPCVVICCAMGASCLSSFSPRFLARLSAQLSSSFLVNGLLTYIVLPGNWPLGPWPALLQPSRRGRHLGHSPQTLSLLVTVTLHHHGISPALLMYNQQIEITCKVYNMMV